MSSNKPSSQSKNSQYFQYSNLNQQILSDQKQSFNQTCKPCQLFEKVQLLKSKTDETQLQPLQGLHSLKKMIKKNKKVEKQKLLNQQMKPWLEQQPTIPFCFEDELSSISCRNQDNTPQDSLISFFRRSQLEYPQQSDRFSQISSYPPIPKYQQFQQKSQLYDNSSQMDQEESSQQSELKPLQPPSNIIQSLKQSNQRQEQVQKQNNQVDRQNAQNQTQSTSPVCFVLPRPNRYIHNFYKNKQLIVFPEYESKIQDNSILAVKGIEFSVKLRCQQKVKYPQFLPQLYRSEMEDNLRRQAMKKLSKSNQLKNEHNQKLQEKSSQNQSQTDQNQN